MPWNTITWASNYNSNWIAVIGMHIDDEGCGAAVEVVSSPHNITSDIVAHGGYSKYTASYCKPKIIRKPEILDPKKYLALKFSTQKQDYKCTGKHVAEKSSNEYFSDPLIAMKTRNEKKICIYF